MPSNPQGGAFVYVDEASVRKLQAATKAIRSSANGKELLKLMNKEIEEAVKPMVDDLQVAAKGLHFESSSNRGHSRYSRRGYRTQVGTIKNAKTGELYTDREGNVLDNVRTRQKKRKGGRGFREELAFGIKTKISRGAGSTGVRVRLASTDSDVNRLGKRINAKGQVRHPLFGDTDHWYVTKTTNGKRWFTDTGSKHLPLVRRRLERVLDKWVADLAAKVDRAA